MSIKFSPNSVRRDLAWQAGSQLLSLAAGAGALAVIARYLGPAAFGILAAAIALVGMLMPLANVAREEVIVREWVAGRGHHAEWLTAAWLIRLCGALVLIPIIVVSWRVLQPRGEHGLVIAAAALIPLCGTISVATMPLVAEKSFATLGRQRVMAGLLGNGLRALAAWLGFGAAGVAAGTAIQNTLVGLQSALRLRHRRLVPRLNREAFRTVFLTGIVLMGAQLMSAAYYNVDQVMLLAMRGQLETGHYAAAVRVTLLAQAVPLALIAVLTPRLYKQQDRADYARAYQSVMALALGLAGALLLGNKLIIHWVFGPEFSPATTSLSILAVAIVPAVLGVMVSRQLLAYGQQRLLLYMTFIGLLTNVGLNWLLIPVVGGVGAAWASLISYAVATYSSLLLPVARGVRHSLLSAHGVPDRFLRAK